MAGQTPQSVQVYSVYTEGQKANLTPHLGFDPAIGSPCKQRNCVVGHCIPWLIALSVMQYYPNHINTQSILIRTTY